MPTMKGVRVMNKILSTFKSTKELFLLAYKLSPQNICYTVLSSVINAAKGGATLLLPAVLLNTIQNAKNFWYVVAVILAYVVIVTVADMSYKSFQLQLTALGYGLSNKAALSVGKKGMRLDFKNWEDPALLNKSREVVMSTWMFMGISDVLCDNLLNAVISIAVISYIVLQANIWVWLAVIVLVAVGAWVNRSLAKKMHSFEERRSAIDTKIEYNKEIISDIKYGKEIRLFNASEFFCKKYKEAIDQGLELERQKQGVAVKYGIASQFLYLAESVVVYYFAILKFAKGLLSIGYFLTFFNAVREFTRSLGNLFQVWLDLAEIDDYYREYKAFMENDDSMHKGTRHIEKNDSWELEFKNVYFRYPNTDADVLENVNMTISKGDKVAFVGENGSGKTTLIKLLLRLYDPTQGEILLNGINIKEYVYEEYLNSFAPIFQDYQLHAYSIRENIAFDKTGCDDKIKALLEENELGDVISQLPNGLDTYVTELLDEDGRNFSGGEKQKIAMARAQFKGADNYVLDEPTSAMDPISEVNFYNRVNEMTENNTTVFVSHRMASTKFADRIFVLQNGKLEEQGSFAELMEKNGLYAEMFGLQAGMYKES